MFLTAVLCRFYDFEKFAEIAYADDAHDDREPSKEVTSRLPHAFQLNNCLLFKGSILCDGRLIPALAIP